MKKNKNLRRKYGLILLSLLAVSMMLTPNTSASPIITTDAPTGVQATNSTLWGNLTYRGTSPTTPCQVSIGYAPYGSSLSYTTPVNSPTYYTNTTTSPTNVSLFNTTHTRWANRINSFNGTPISVKFYFLKGLGTSGNIYARVRYVSNDTIIASASSPVAPLPLYGWAFPITFTFTTTNKSHNQDIYISAEYNGGGYLYIHNAATGSRYYYNGTAWNTNTTGQLAYNYRYAPNYYLISYNYTLLDPGRLYHYQAHANNSGDSYPWEANGIDRNILTKPKPLTSLTAPNATTTSITLNWTLGEGADGAYIEYTTAAAAPSPWNPGGATKINASGYITGSTYTHTPLAHTGRYYYKAWSYATDHGWRSNGNASAPWGDTPLTLTALKAPEAPTNTNITVINTTKVNLTWVKGTNANNTIIIKKPNSVPTSITDGTLIYNDTGNYSVQTITPGELTFYRAWSYRYYTTPAASRYSSNYTDFNATGLYITVQDEENCSNLTYDVLIKNKAGTQVYNQKGLTGLLVVNVSQCPTGDDVSIIVSATGHRYRQYYIDLQPGAFFYYLQAYLPRNESADLYLFQVFAPQNEYANSPPIHNALVTVRSYINCTDSYYTISNTYTDANGQTEVYLIRNQLHIVILEKEYYDTVTEDYTTDASYRQRVFKMYYTQTSITPEDTLFTNIEWSIEPTSSIHYDTYPVYFNITSSDNKLEWFYMKVYYYNQSLNTWTLLFSSNQTNASGGSITYTIPDTTGKYAIDCVFKKQGYPEYELAQTGSLIQFIQHLNEAFKGIPDMAFFVGLIIIMMVVMGFFMLYIGSGILTGYVGLGIFFMGLLMKPLTIPIGGQDTVSGWVIFAITLLAYTMGTFLWSKL